MRFRRHRRERTEKDYSLALTEARRRFDGLEEQLHRIRSIASSLLGFAAVAFTLLTTASGQIAGKPGTALLIVATGLFAALAFVVVWVVWPVKLIPGVDAWKLVGWTDRGDSSSSSERELAVRYDEALGENAKKISQRYRGQMLALILFGSLIVVLVIRLIGT
jgi:predicted nucleotidyltransferase